ncbi:MAG: 3-isopropylmalate dehydratase large subunit [Deltaproteobacteria bacterium]|nr:3-isopropylmalate dehydratase large subunit [Deltaproteobacteria bacterium]
MGMTIVEKILASHAGLDRVVPGQLVEARVDRVLANDITAPIAIREFRQAGAERVFDPQRIILVPDHFAPNKDIASAEQCKLVREFAREQQLAHYFEVGRMGIEHALLPEQGLVLPGEIIIGADSHTCTHGALNAFATGVGSTDVAAAMIAGELWFKVPETMKFVFSGQLRPWVSGKDLILFIIGDIGVDGALYRAMEFGGDAIDRLSMDGRLTMANMAIEAGGKCGIFATDAVTEAYLKGRATQPWSPVAADADARYCCVKHYRCEDIEPQVAFPHSPDNTRPISAVGTVPIHQAVVGSCTNGRIEDLRAAAAILKGRKTAPGVRLIIFPATQAIYLQALREGLLETFIEAEAVVSTPTCGPCLGGHMGILARGETAIATTNRNFVGRMGHPESFVYLANPAITAASAVLGRIGSPDEL